MKNLRLYGMMTTFALALNVSGMLIWDFCPKLDIIDVMAYAIFISLAAAGVFVLLTEPKRRKQAKWVQVGGISIMVQRSGKKW